MGKCLQKSCPYHGNRIEVPYSGSKDVDVLIVGESPGTTEESLGKPFVGKSGDVLNALLASVELDRSMVFIANAARCRIDKDNDPLKDQNSAVKHCRVYLEKAIQIIKPKVIVSLGGVALKQLTGKQAILQNRGRVFESEWGIPVVCTIHPAYVLRGAQKGFPNIPPSQMSQKERMIFEDFKLVRDVLSSKYGSAAEREAAIGGTDLTAYREGTAADLKKFAKEKYLAFDYETNGLDEKASGFKILSFAICGENGYARTFFVKGNKLPVEFKKILENPQIVKITASRGFEEKVSRMAGAVMKGVIHDVLVMAHLVDENGVAYDLETLAGAYTPLRHIKDVIGGKKGRAERIAAADKQTLVTYNAIDAHATYLLFFELKKRLEADPLLARYYVNLTIPFQNMLAETYEYGCKIDRKALKDANEFIDKEIETQGRAARRLIPEAVREAHEGQIDLGRRKMIIDVLFTKKGFGLRPMQEFLTPKTKEPKCSKEHLQNFEDGDSEVSQFITAYLAWGTATKFKATYLDRMDEWIRSDGKVHPDILINRTVTGRTVTLSPPITLFPARGDLSKVVKRTFAADTGWVMIGRDLGQSEMRIAGWQANDLNILKALAAGKDIHTTTAAMTSGMSYEEVLEHPDKKSLRQKAKAVNFGFLFGMGAAKFQKYAKANYGVTLTLEECEEIRRKFFSKPDGYYRLPVFHEMQRFKVRRDGFVRSPIGRKRNLPDIYSSDRSISSGAERQAINTPIQSFSSDLGEIAMMLFHEAVKRDPKLAGKARAMFFIHDAIYGQAKKGVAKRAMKLMKECLEVRAPAYILERFGVKVGYPVTSDGHMGPNWADMEEVE